MVGKFSRRGVFFLGEDGRFVPGAFRVAVLVLVGKVAKMVLDGVLPVGFLPGIPAWQFNSKQASPGMEGNGTPKGNGRHQWVRYPEWFGLLDLQTAGPQILTAGLDLLGKRRFPLRPPNSQTFLQGGRCSNQEITTSMEADWRLSC